MDAGGLLVTKSLPQVRVGASHGGVNGDLDWPSERVSYVVVWVTEDNRNQSLSGIREPEQLVAIARSLACAEPG